MTRGSVGFGDLRLRQYTVAQSCSAWRANEHFRQAVKSMETPSMHEFKCDVCGRPAPIHETVVEAGGMVDTQNYCELHADRAPENALRIYAPDRDAALARLAKRYFQLTDTEKERLKLEHRLATRCR
jgi:hypothetical protein